MKISVDPRDVIVFVEVCRQLSLSRAAKVLQLPVSHVSRRLRSLEEALGTRLINRTTRHLEVTEVGATYAELCAESLSRLATAQDYIESVKGEPQGRVRVLCPNEFAQHLCERHMAPLLERHPKLSIDLVIKSRATLQDYASLDVFVEVGQVFAPGDFVQKKITSVVRRLYASPRFKERERLTHIDHVRPEQMLSILSDRGDSPATDTALVNVRTEERRDFSAAHPFRVNSLTATMKLAIAGMGLCLIPAFLARDEVAAGSLVPVLRDWRSHPVDIFCAIEPGKRNSPKVRAVAGAIDRVRFE